MHYSGAKVGQAQRPSTSSLTRCFWNSYNTPTGGLMSAASGRFTEVSGQSGILGPEIGYDLTLDQLARLVQVIANFHIGVDAQGVVERCQQVVGVNRLFLRRGCRLVRFAILHAGSDTATCHDRAVAVRPVIAPVGRVAVAGGADAKTGRAAELADRDD